MTKIRERLTDSLLLERAIKYGAHGDKDECWNWNGALQKGGYGVYWDGKRSGPAHRIIFEAHHGIRLGRWELVCHSCDNPRCVNPSHLWNGSPKQNTDDMIKKGRRKQSPKCGEALKNGRAAGSKNNRAVLTEEQVLYIKSAKASGQELADKFGVKRGQIYKIRCGLAWKHMDAR